MGFAGDVDRDGQPITKAEPPAGFEQFALPPAQSDNRTEIVPGERDIGAAARLMNGIFKLHQKLLALLDPGNRIIVEPERRTRSQVCGAMMDQGKIGKAEFAGRLLDDIAQLEETAARCSFTNEAVDQPSHGTLTKRRHFPPSPSST